jgi:hypothetical protein
MSWHPNDLVTDADLLAYEPTLTGQFGRVEWADKRSKALEDWLFPSLVARGLDPDRLRTRLVPRVVLSETAGTITDRTAAATSATADDLPLGAILTGTADALYVGHDRPFRGVSLRMADTPSSTAATLAGALWEDAWVPLVVQDGTQVASGKTCSKGGAVTWRQPAGWVVRTLSGQGPYYWARLSVSAALTAGARAGSLSVIRRSLFCAPAVYKTLEWIFRAAPTGQDGPWTEKALFYADAADVALGRSLVLAGGEFDTDPVDDVIDATEATQTIEAAGSVPGWTLERG